MRLFAQTYTFNGNGFWSAATNWFNNTVPPNILPGGSVIYIAPAPGDSCVLDVPQTIAAGASLIIAPGANFVIAGGVIVNNVSAQPSTAICSQVWMTKNLTVSAYRNGDLIPEVTDNNQWNNLTTGAWCWYNNDSVNYAKYGKLYNWYALNDSRGVAPNGWRIPDSTDIARLIQCYGNYFKVGGALKETGTINWDAPNEGASNIFGFTALPGGHRWFGSFGNLRNYVYYWQSDQNIQAMPNQFLITYSNAGLLPISSYKNDGAYIRCLRDTVVSPSELPIVTTMPASSITVTTAVSGGEIISDGGYPIIEKGIVWGMSPNPNLSDLQTIDGNGSGAFVSNMALLSGNRTYYVRAYARNQLGVGYGNEISFTTLPVLPSVVSTLPVVFYKDTMAFGQGKVIDYGGGSLSEFGVVFSTSPNPTIADRKSVRPVISLDSFYARCTSLLSNTTYYVKAYAINEAGVSYGDEISFTTAASSPGNVIVSDQVWMPKDLAVTNYRNGDPIPQVTDPAAWAALTTGAWCWYNNDSATYASVYGRIYNGYAITDPRGLAPLGWHVPADADWDKLAIVLGGFYRAGGGLKDTSDLYWPPSFYDDNRSGFTALPNGMRQVTGNFFAIGYYGNWWSAGSIGGGPNSYSLQWFDENLTLTLGINKKYGFSVRCLKD